jgi:hypothetical protein
MMSEASLISTRGWRFRRIRAELEYGAVDATDASNDRYWGGDGGTGLERLPEITF